MVFTYAEEGGVAQIRTEESTTGNATIVQDARQDAYGCLRALNGELSSRMKYQERLPGKP